MAEGRDERDPMFADPSNMHIFAILHLTYFWSFFVSTELYIFSSGPLLECKICDKGHIKREKKVSGQACRHRTDTDTVCSCCWTD